MKSKLLVLFLSVLLLTIVFIGCFEEEKKQIRIQELIDAASPGDTINIPSGTYSENIIINKSIKLIGENKEATIIDGGYLTVISISADDVTVSNFTIQNGFSGIGIAGSNNVITNNILQDCTNFSEWSKKTGIKLEMPFYPFAAITISSGSNNTISENQIRNNDFAAITLIEETSQNKIHNNTISDNTYGIFLCYYTDGNVIKNNDITMNDIGISIYSSNNTIELNFITYNMGNGVLLTGTSDNTIKNNTFLSDGITIEGDVLNYWNSHLIENNMVNNKPIYYYKNKNLEFTVPEDAGQVIIANCSLFTIKNLDISNLENGIQLGFSSNINISDNNVLNSTYYGICLWNSNNNRVSNNTMIKNGWKGEYSAYGSGIFLSSESNNNTITKNNISEGIYNGIELSKSSNNNISDNILANNNGRGIYLATQSNNNDINKNTITGSDINHAAIYFYDVTNNEIRENKINNSVLGIYLSDSTYNTIFMNDISYCSYYGLYNSPDNYAADNNIIYCNNFFKNDVNAFDECNNTWYIAILKGGNYWDDYNGTDEDSNGIGDTPYSIPGGNSQDYYPSIRRIENVSEIQSYIACGCGCCGGTEPLTVCLYHSKGDDIRKIIEEDIKMSQSPDCALVGCSIGIKYIYCD